MKRENAINRNPNKRAAAGMFMILWNPNKQSSINEVQGKRSPTL